MIKPKPGSFANQMYEAGRKKGREETIELVIKSTILWLYSNGVEAENLPAFQSGLMEAVMHNAETPGLLDEAFKEMEEETGVTVNFL